MMGASSVTGVSGPGDSGGKYKPELHCGGCGCGSADEETPASPPAKRGCVTSHVSGRVAGHKIGSSSSNIKVC